MSLASRPPAGRASRTRAGARAAAPVRLRATPARADGNLQAMAADPDARRALAALLPGRAGGRGSVGRPGRGPVAARALRARRRQRLAHLLAPARGSAHDRRAAAVRSGQPVPGRDADPPPGLDLLALRAGRARARRARARDVAADTRSALASLGALDAPAGRRLRLAKRREILHVGRARHCCGSPASRRRSQALSDAGRRAHRGGARWSDALRERSLPHRRPGAVRGAGLRQARRRRAELQLGRRPRLRVRAATTAGAPARGASARAADAGARTTSPRRATSTASTCACGRRAAPAASPSRLGAFAAYYRARGATWERLALLKARPVAGDLELGRRCLEETAPFVFDRPFDAARARRTCARSSSRSTRASPARSETDRHVKLGRGGIREIELVAQVLQLRFGAGRPRCARAARSRRSTRCTCGRPGCRRAPTRSRDAYVFLRDVENKLQMVADAQVHLLPAIPPSGAGSRCGSACATAAAAAAEAALHAEYRRHTDAVHRASSSASSVAG